jgi:hypothetical protein
VVTEEYHLHGCDAVLSGRSQVTFQRNILPSENEPSKNSESRLFSCLACFFTLLMEARCFSEMLVDFYLPYGITCQ